jgi:preprotein translocase subunit SecD
VTTACCADPGGQLDREQARNLLQKTGFLEFKIVLEEAPSEELLRKRHEAGLPPETEIVFEKEKGSDRVLGAYLVPKAPNLTGESLTDARSGMDPRYVCIVNFTFNSDGATKFGKLTGDNIGKRLAILLDGQVLPRRACRRASAADGLHPRSLRFGQRGDLSVILRAARCRSR